MHVTYGDGVLALAEGVPQLDGLVARSRHDLSVVGREGNAQHVLLVIVELARGLAPVLFWDCHLSFVKKRNQSMRRMSVDELRTESSPRVGECRPMSPTSRIDRRTR